MSQLSFSRAPATAQLTNLRRAWTPTAMVWGAGVGVALTFFLSSTPLVKRELLSKLPVIGEHFTDKTPDSDKPF